MTKSLIEQEQEAEKLREEALRASGVETVRNPYDGKLYAPGKEFDEAVKKGEADSKLKIRDSQSEQEADDVTLNA